MDNEENDTVPTLPKPECAAFEERGTAEQLAALYAALATARGQFGAIEKTRTVKVRMKSGGEYEFTYADMQALLAATTDALSKNGLAFLSPFTRVEPDVMTQHAILSHASGGRLVFVYKFAPPKGEDLKTLGGEETYLMRYAYRSVLTLPGGEDMDEMPQERVRGEQGAEAYERPRANPNGPNNTQRMPPSQRPTPNPAQPAAVDKAAQNRLTELKAQLRNNGYTTIKAADERIAKALGFVVDWQAPGTITQDQHDALMNGLLEERAAQMAAKGSAQ